MIKRLKQVSVIISTVGIILFLAVIGLIGGFDVKSTFNTNYELNNDRITNIVKTELFKIELPKSWTHVSAGTGICATHFGGFITPNGIINYSIDPLAIDYSVLDSIYVFSVLQDRSENLIVYTGINDDGSKCGMTIHDLNLNQNFTLHMSSSLMKNSDYIIRGLDNFEFYVRYTNN